ncbi:MAG: 2-dehydropantoate 2-reductase [Halobacteriales archaeon]|jgi:2-dehydropantoate 2-reductase
MRLFLTPVNSVGMDIVVFGAGSLGSLFGGLLAREHDVTLVGREDHVEAIDSSGLRVTAGFEEPPEADPGEIFDFIVHPPVTTDGRTLSADLAVVTVKAFDTESGADALATGSYDVVCSLQNGMGNEAILADALDSHVLAGTTTYGALQHEPGRVECTGLGEVVLGPYEGGTSPEAERVDTAFSTADVDVTVAEDMPRRLWKKLAVNAGINAVTALARIPNGEVLEGPAHELARDAARETARVARAAGVDLSDREAVTAVESVAKATAANTSSMHQDVNERKRTEVDAINGYVADRAAELREGRATTPADAYEITAPVNRTMASLLRAWESGLDLRA